MDENDSLLEARKAAAELSPENASRRYVALNNEAMIRHDVHKHALALVWAERATQLEPDSAQKWARLAHTLFRLGRFADAVHASDVALGLDAQSVNAWATKCESLNQLQRDEDLLVAAEGYRIAIERLHVSSGQMRDKLSASLYWRFKGAALKRLGRHAEAREAQRIADSYLN